jgi:AcrR family transcriptional regulator
METAPRRRDADRSRADILDAAERLFAAEGFDSVTMAEIGAAAGLSRGTPGYFFGQKEQLYRVVLERAAATFRMLGETLRLRDAVGARNRQTVLRETIESFVGLLVARREVVRLLDRDGGQTVGSPHVDAINDALSGLGDERGPLALTIATLAWYPVSHPEAATALGVDATAPGFAAAWSAHIVAVAEALPETPVMALPEPSHAPPPVLEEPPAPPAAPPANTPTPAVAEVVEQVEEPAVNGSTESGVTTLDERSDPVARFVTEVVVGDKKKKKKKKKKDKGL